jgi:CRP/FNR family transcriptional regulator, cyclic AMP receptor protein
MDRPRRMRRGAAKKSTRFSRERYCFFAHVAFAFSAAAHATPQATANLLIEVTDKILAAALRKKQLKSASLKDFQKAELAGEIAMKAALRYLKSQREFRQFPARRFVNFDFIRPPGYISIRPAPDRVLRDGTMVWRVAESDADMMRGEPLSVRYPDIEKRLAAHPFLKGLTRHHIELLALCAVPTQLEPGHTIFLEGEPANGFYLIETGKVVLEGKTKDVTQLVIDTVSAGEPLGWSWLFPPYLWHYTARAIEQCRAICLSGTLLRQHRDDDPTLSHELFRRASEVMVRRLQRARERLISRTKNRR